MSIPPLIPSSSTKKQKPTVYQRRAPERCVLYQLMQQKLESWLERSAGYDRDSGCVPAYLENDFRRYLECGIVAYGFAPIR